MARLARGLRGGATEEKVVVVETNTEPTGGRGLGWRFFATIPHMAFYWTCPYCDRDTTITNTFSTDSFVLRQNNSEGPRHFGTLLIVCPNPKCLKFTLTIEMYNLQLTQSGPDKILERLQTWMLIPPSSAKVFPDYVPKVIRDDYTEACAIRDLSPKASATLSRRCLQGMIRDFWKVSKGRLVDEIDAIKDKLDTETWAAIDIVRKIGNIGAHMEKDINVIIDVEPNEAQLLIGLIELLVKDWYIVRHDRAERLKEIVTVGQAKKAAKDATPTV
jgi:hypothetical protein